MALHEETEKQPKEKKEEYIFQTEEIPTFSERDMIEFIEWCNYPIYRAPGELGFKLRVQPQFPEYNTYIILDQNGYSLHPKGVYLTAGELLRYWKKQKIK